MLLKPTLYLRVKENNQINTEIKNIFKKEIAVSAPISLTGLAKNSSAYILTLSFDMITESIISSN